MNDSELNHLVKMVNQLCKTSHGTEYTALMIAAKNEHNVPCAKGNIPKGHTFETNFAMVKLIFFIR